MTFARNSMPHAATTLNEVCTCNTPISRHKKPQKAHSSSRRSLYFPYFSTTKKMHALVNVCALCRFARSGALLRAMQLELRLKVVPEALNVFFKGHDKKRNGKWIYALQKKEREYEFARMRKFLGVR